MVARVLLLEDGKICDVFETVEVADSRVRVRSPFLFEIGEQLAIRIERDGAAQEATARVRGHAGDGDDKITELELADLGEPRRVVAG